jgi:hypothetical protein
MKQLLLCFLYHLKHIFNLLPVILYQDLLLSSVRGYFLNVYSGSFYLSKNRLNPAAVSHIYI